MSAYYQLVKQLSTQHSIQTICAVFGISRSAYYAYDAGTTYHLQGAKQALADRIKEIFDYHKRRYGSRRIQSVLQDEGHQIGLHQVRKRMREQGLVAIQPKSFVPITTQTHPHLKRSPNLLLLPDNEPTAPNQVIVGDITYLPNKEAGYDKWLYLAVWLDLFSRRIVGWHIDRHMEDSLVITALQQVIQNRQPLSNLIVHSDGGGQYGSLQFRALLSQQQYRQSMTRKDNHYDNAHIESLFGRFKIELLQGETFFGIEDAYYKSFEYIEGYYNRIRKHSSLGYKSPIQFEQQYTSTT